MKKNVFDLTKEDVVKVCTHYSYCNDCPLFCFCFFYPDLRSYKGVVIVDVPDDKGDCRCFWPDDIQF